MSRAPYTIGLLRDAAERPAGCLLSPIRHMGLQITIEREQRPPIRTVASPVTLSDTPSPLPAPPPEFGEHTDEVLASIGYDVAEIETLRAKGVLSGATDSN